MQQVGITADEAKVELEAVWDTDPELDIIPLAPSFSAFISGLYEDEEDE